MTAQVVDEFLVLEKYRVMVLDQDIPGGRWAHYQINGEVFDPVRIHVQTQAAGRTGQDRLYHRGSGQSRPQV